VRQLLNDARADKAKELIQEYARGEREALTLVNGILTDAGISLDHFMTEALRDRIHEVETIDRLILIAKTRRNDALRRSSGVARSSAKYCDAACTRSKTASSRRVRGELVPELPPAEGKTA
jgi:hypothetical protein